MNKQQTTGCSLVHPSKLKRAYEAGRSKGRNPMNEMYNPYSLGKQQQLYFSWKEGFKDGMAISMGIKEVKRGSSKGNNLDVHA